MTVEEIFKKLGTRMIQGLMIHDEFANYYDFLALKGYAMCHEYHYKEESCWYRKLNHYFITHYGKVIEKEKVDGKELIPSSWYSHKREDVDSNLKRESVKMGIQTWVAWETETKKLYEEMYKELIGLDQFALAMFVGECVCNVDKELTKAKQKHLELKATGYDIGHIISCQSKMYHKYKNK